MPDPRKNKERYEHKRFHHFKARLAKEFNSLNRNLIVADQAESWQPAVIGWQPLDEVKLLLETAPSSW